MRRRCELINREKPACVVSIHQNSYHEESIHGAQVFYYKTSKESGELAKILQKELARVVEPTNHRQAKANDTYYLLKKTGGAHGHRGVRLSKQLGRVREASE